MVSLINVAIAIMTPFLQQTQKARSIIHLHENAKKIELLQSTLEEYHDIVNRQKFLIQDLHTNN